MTKRLGWILAGFVCCSVANAALDRLPDDAVLIDRGLIDTPAAAIHALRELIVAGRTDDTIAQLASIADPLTREATAAALLDHLQQRGITTPAAVLDAIDAWPVRIFRRHEETAADWFVPVYDLPGRVQSMRRLAARDAEVAALLSAMAGKRGDASVTTLAAATPQVAALAVAALPPAAFATLTTHAKAARQPLPSPALAAIARRTADADTMLLALDGAAPLDVFPLLSDTLPALPHTDADRVLRHASTRPEYASAAAFERTRRTPAHDTDTLRHALSDPSTGASVAAALAQRPDAIARIDTLLTDTDDATALTHLALALRLHGSEHAAQRLLALREDPRLPADVRAELQR